MLTRAARQLKSIQQREPAVGMARGFLYVESRPSAPDRVIDYNDWYDHVHLPEVPSIDGFISATRRSPVDDAGFYIALYQMQCEDTGAAFTRLTKTAWQGLIHLSDALEMDPPPIVRLLKVISQCAGNGPVPVTIHTQE